MIFRAPEPDLAIAEVALTPWLLERAEGRGEMPALVEGPSGRTLTFGGWATAVRQAAVGLDRRGFRKGDVLAIYSHNVPEYAVAFHAVSLLGGAVTTINPLYTPAELVHQLEDARARFLVTAPPFMASAQQAAHEIKLGGKVRPGGRVGLEEVFVFGECPGATPFASLLDSTGEPPAVTIEPRRDTVALPYSSGTTGMPKGVMLTHHNLVANLLQSELTIGVREGDVVLGVLPFFHIYGMVVIMNLALYVGATVITMPRFDLEGCLQILERHRVTFAYVVPPIVLALAKSPLVEKYDLSSVRALFSGAAPLGDELSQAAGRRLGCTVAQGYGMTETSPVTHSGRGGGRTSPASIGPPVPNTEVKIVDVATRAELGPREEGEICVRGPQVMKGYLNRPADTAAMIDEDGWLHTGDIGFADEQGDFFIVDRLKELIKYKGMQIAPAELEAVLLGHALIADAAVIPIPDEEAGEVPKAFVVLKGDLTPADILAYVAARVAPYKKLRSVEIIDAIPKSPSGKILRRILVERQRHNPLQP
jgi:acyl-CoA synthetase (AMP-forming)/AMP-acid ligase II